MQAMRWGVNSDGPSGRDARLIGADPGLLEQFPARACLEIDPVAEDVARIRGAGGKVDLPGVERMLRHLAEQEGAVGAAEGGHRKAIVDGFAGLAEFVPGEKVGVIRLEEGARSLSTPSGRVSITRRPRSSTRPLNSMGLVFLSRAQ